MTRIRYIDTGSTSIETSTFVSWSNAYTVWRDSINSGFPEVYPDMPVDEFAEAPFNQGFPEIKIAIGEATHPTYDNDGDAFAHKHFYPSQSTDISLSTLQGASIFYGNFLVSPDNARNAGCTVELTAPYSLSPTGTSTRIRNMDLTAHSITMTAKAVYPFYFDRWRGGSPSGTVLGTSNTLTITDAAVADYQTYYAVFGTSHTDPTDSSGFKALTAGAQTIRIEDSCTILTYPIENPYRYNGDDNNNTPVAGDTVYTGSSGTTLASTGVYGLDFGGGDYGYMQITNGIVTATGSCGD